MVLKSPQLTTSLKLIATIFEYMLFKVQIDRSQPQYFVNVSTEVDRNTRW